MVTIQYAHKTNAYSIKNKSFSIFLKLPFIESATTTQLRSEIITIHKFFFFLETILSSLKIMQGQNETVNTKKMIS